MTNQTKSIAGLSVNNNCFGNNYQPQLVPAGKELFSKKPNQFETNNQPAASPHAGISTRLAVVPDFPSLRAAKQLDSNSIERVPRALPHLMPPEAAGRLASNEGQGNDIKESALVRVFPTRPTLGNRQSRQRIATYSLSLRDSAFC